MKKLVPQPEDQTRRDFVKKVAVASSGIMFSSLPLSAAVSIDGTDEIKVALIGCGGRGTGAASQAINADPGVRIVAVADVFEDRLTSCLNTLSEAHANSAALKTKPQSFIGFDAYRKAIDLADVAILTTPPGFRPAHFEYAVEKGKQVFMEKPVATDVVGIKQILKAAKVAKQKKLNVVVGLQRRYQKSYVEVEKLLRKGKVGDIIGGQVYWNSDGVWVNERQPDQTELEYQMRNWYYFNWLCGDHILEQHIHNIDIANWFIGTHPVLAQGMGGREVRNGKDHGQIFDHHFVEFEYPTGAIISSQCRHQPGCLSRVDERFQGTKGNVIVDSSSKGIMKNYKGKVIYQHNGSSDVNPYQQEHNELFDAIRKGEFRYQDAENAAHSSMTSILGRMATYSGQAITWDEAMNSDLDLGTNVTSWDDPPPVLPDTMGQYPIAKPGKTSFLS
jgi:predicted dehydrogenase